MTQIKNAGLRARGPGDPGRQRARHPAAEEDRTSEVQGRAPRGQAEGRVRGVQGGEGKIQGEIEPEA